MNAQTHTPQQMSQCQVIGCPPVKTWAEYRHGCVATFHGGYREAQDAGIFAHGMNTVFNLLEQEFPPAPLCQAAPDLLAALRLVLYRLNARTAQIESCDLPIEDSNAINSAMEAISRATQ